MSFRYDIDAVVDVVPTSTTDALRLAGVDVAAGIRDDLLSVATHNSLAMPYGTFAFDLAARPVLGPRTTWADWIEPYSLVTIALQRYGSPPAGALEHEVVMLGLVDCVETCEDYSAAEPRRVVRVTGRSLSAVLTDHAWWHHWWLADPSKVPADFRQFFAPSIPESQRQREISLATPGAYAIDWKLLDDAMNQHPAYAQKLLWEFFVGKNSGDAHEAFIKLTLDQERPLRDRLRFDPEAAKDSSFDPQARLSRQVLPSYMTNATCWQMLRYFAEDGFSELYTDCFGTGSGDAVCEVRCRKPPFAGHISYEGNDARVASIAAGGATGTLFDAEYPGWQLTQNTTYIDGSDVIAVPCLRRGVAGEMVNSYEVLPMQASAAGNMIGDRALQREIPPLIDEDGLSPSRIQRYGIRPRQYRTKYAPITTVDGDTRPGDVKQQCMAYELLLREWNHRLPAMWSGSYALKGRPSFRVGRRLVDADTNREFYVEAVTHRMRLGSSRPAYTTTLQVARGWRLGG